MDGWEGALLCGGKPFGSGLYISLKVIPDLTLHLIGWSGKDLS